MRLLIIIAVAAILAAMMLFQPSKPSVVVVGPQPTHKPQNVTVVHPSPASVMPMAVGPTACPATYLRVGDSLEVCGELSYDGGLIRLSNGWVKGRFTIHGMSGICQINTASMYVEFYNCIVWIRPS